MEAPTVWKPPVENLLNSSMAKFIEQAGFANFSELYDWSIKDPNNFWLAVWKTCKIISNKTPEKALVQSAAPMKAKWFPEIKLNYAENLLKNSGDAPAVIFWGEESARETLSFNQLRENAAKVAVYLKSIGVASGDRVAGFVPNIPSTLCCMLGAVSIGAVWSSCSPDFGPEGALERFEQIQPKVLIAADGYTHKGRKFSSLDRVETLAGQISSITNIIILPYLSAIPDLSALSEKIRAKCVHYNELPAQRSPLIFEQLPFDHPLFIMFSSGTTGKPKCIVHSAGGTLLEHMKELMLHSDLRPGDRLFYQTTCGWMMWNWLVSGLACGATVCLYDGFPLLRHGKILWDFAAENEVTHFGTNAKYLSAIEKENVTPATSHQLSKLRCILSTGSPLAPESYEYVYDKVNSEVQLSSISGGTDILGCFALGSPVTPVRKGELQVRSLGLAVEVYNDDGKSIVGEKGELVCTAPFPSMPVEFWNDPNGERYHSAYFETFPGVWHHGDFAEITKSGGLIIYGRSDAVLNPGGVRIGTAEIYRQVEKLDFVQESIAVGVDKDGDVKIVLFVILKGATPLSEELEGAIRSIIKTNASPFHVPWKILQVNDIPRTRNGKIVELAVRDLLMGKEPKNLEAIANPEALEFFRSLKF